MKLLSQLKNLKGKTILVRVDWNVASAKEARFLNSIPTLKYLLKKGARIIILSHKGAPKKSDPKLSLSNFLTAVKKAVGVPVKFWAGDIVDIRVILVENIRFYENAAKGQLAKQLAALADAFVFEAFSVAHHGAPSVNGVAKLLPTYLGPAFIKEIKFLNKIKKPKAPWVVILGGIKISDKLKNIKLWLDQGAYLFLGGGAANTFLKATGAEVGKSLVDDGAVKTAKKLLADYPDQIHLPDDLVVSGKKPQIIDKEKLGKKDAILDLGPFTVAKYTRAVMVAKTIFWVGSLGKTEDPLYQASSLAMADFLGQAKKRGANVVIGGGDTGALLIEKKLTKCATYISTGGGAFLSYLAGEKWKILS